MLRPTHAQCGRNVYAGCGSERSKVAPARTYVCLEERTVNTTKLRSCSWNEPPACAHASNYIRALRLPRSQTNATHRMKRCRERQTQSLGVEICSSCLRQLMLTHVRQESKRGLTNGSMSRIGVLTKGPRLQPKPYDSGGVLNDLLRTPRREPETKKTRIREPEKCGQKTVPLWPR